MAPRTRRRAAALRWSPLPLCCCALLLCATLVTGADCPNGAPSLPRNPAAWAAGPSRPSAPSPPPHAACSADGKCAPPWELQESPEGGFWDRARLARAAIATHTPDAWAPLVAKLRRGEAITMLALGSSVVEGHAGCFVADAAALAATGVAAAPPATWRALNATGACIAPGYASAFMAALNATWPHTAHVLINAGVAGAALHAFASHICFQDWLPTASGADLLFFEQHGGDGDDTQEALRNVEALYHETAALLTHAGNSTRAPPPLVLLNMFPLTDAGHSADKSDSSGAESMAACVGRAGKSCSACGAAAAALAPRLAAATGRSVEDVLAAAARRYGWASLSMRDALAAGLRDGAHTALGWSECEWLNAFMKDRVHPSLNGRRLIADALLQLLLAVQDATPQEACAATAAPIAPVQPVSLPAGPLVAGAWAPLLRSCAHAEQLRVMGAAGWSFSQTERVKDKDVFKPGWIADAPGAVLDFNFSTRFAELAPDARAQLSVRYLVSYERMGAARLSCVAGCDCAPATLQAHGERRVSVEIASDVAITQATDCALRLTVLNETESPDRGFKFKLIGVSVNAQLADAERVLEVQAPLALLTPQQQPQQPARRQLRDVRRPSDRTL